ncbi:MAG TPA: hypothetical protein VHZ95_12960 [Polyangiales bacterium]|nr:hypothetical protein [Polyangiales bacterium]
MRLWLRIGVAAWLLANLAAAPLERDPVALLTRAVDAGELDLASLVARLGDAALLDAIVDGKSSVLMLAAVRGAPYLRDPERALEPLAAIVEGRDPDLAPSAARRALAIAQALELSDGSARELSASSLRSAEQRFDAIAKRATARTDIRLYAAETAALLRALRDRS